MPKANFELEIDVHEIIEMMDDDRDFELSLTRTIFERLLMGASLDDFVDWYNEGASENDKRQINAVIAKIALATNNPNLELRDGG